MTKAVQSNAAAEQPPKIVNLSNIRLFGVSRPQEWKNSSKLLQFSIDTSQGQ